MGFFYMIIEIMSQRTSRLIFMGASLLLAGTLIPAESARELSAGQAREILRHIGGGELHKSQVRIKQVSPGMTSSDAIVEAQIETAYRFNRTADGWQIADIRLGDQHWESYELITEAVRREKIRRTITLMQQLAAGIAAYQRDHGDLVAVGTPTNFFDLLAPQYISPTLRADLWGEQFIYQRDQQGYKIISSGPDRKMGSADDLVMENGVLRAPTS